MQIPEDLLYTKNHEWVRVEGDKATVGITFYAQSQLGDVVYVDIEDVTTSLRTGGTFGTIEAVKTVSDLFMPVAGSAISINDQLKSHPELINADPYGEGWMIKIQIEKSEELKELLTPTAYRELLA